jgi:hypothetical protein
LFDFYGVYIVQPALVRNLGSYASFQGLMTVTQAAS